MSPLCVAGMLGKFVCLAEVWVGADSHFCATESPENERMSLEKAYYISIGNTSSNHSFSTNMLVFREVVSRQDSRHRE